VSLGGCLVQDLELPLLHGDFANDRFEHFFREATVIIANNLKFGSANQSIKVRQDPASIFQLHVLILFCFVLF